MVWDWCHVIAITILHHSSPWLQFSNTRYQFHICMYIYILHQITYYGFSGIWLIGNKTKKYLCIWFRARIYVCFRAKLSMCGFGRNLRNCIVWFNTRLPSKTTKLSNYASYNNASPLHNPLCQPSILSNIFRIHHWRYPVACRYSHMVHATDRCYTQSVTATTRHPRNTPNVIERWRGVTSHRRRTHVENLTVQKRR